jgi:hypothetical protein
MPIPFTTGDAVTLVQVVGGGPPTAIDTHIARHTDDDCWIEPCPDAPFDRLTGAKRKKTRDVYTAIHTTGYGAREAEVHTPAA